MKEEQPRVAHHNPMPFADHPAHIPRTEGVWCPCIPTPPPPGRRMDGDTVHLVIQARPRHILVTEAVRMDGYDAPETQGPYMDPVRGPAARDYFMDLVLGKKGLVYLFDGIATVNRMPGRLFVWSSGHWQDVSRMMYAAGHIKNPDAPPPPAPPPFPHWAK